MQDCGLGWVWWGWPRCGDALHLPQANHSHFLPPKAELQEKAWRNLAWVEHICCSDCEAQQWYCVCMGCTVIPNLMRTGAWSDLLQSRGSLRSNTKLNGLLILYKPHWAPGSHSPSCFRISVLCGFTCFLKWSREEMEGSLLHYQVVVETRRQFTTLLSKITSLQQHRNIHEV